MQMTLLAAVMGTVDSWSQDTMYVERTSSYYESMISAPPCVSFPLKDEFDAVSADCPPGTHELWLQDITRWRAERRIRIGYDDSRYKMPELQWTQSSFMQPQMMVEDRYFYDPVSGTYTVDRYLDDLRKRYGGIDSVLIWPTYPNMGIDDRNQHDMIRSMPGGVAAVKQMIADFHRNGIRVLFPMMMWDQGTRDPGKPWPQAIAEMMAEIGADGVNGDTQDGVALAFSQAADRVGHPLAFEPESEPHDEQLAWNVLTWGEYQFHFVPSVDRYKWLEPRHMVNISDRSNRNKTDDLQYAFFNGVGWNSWENVWGIWNRVTDRDGEATRRIGTIERMIAPFLVSADWEPFYPMNVYGVFASRWPLGTKTVWTIVNRNEYDVDGQQMSAPFDSETHYYDLYHGQELTPERQGDHSVLSFSIEAHGYGAVLAVRGFADAPTLEFLARMRAMTSRPLADFSSEWKALRQQLAPIAPTRPAAAPPAGMVHVQGGEFTFKVEGIEIEGYNDIGVDVQYPWEDMPRRFHEHRMRIKSFYMDRYPVTNRDFKTFLIAAHYHPRDSQNFLRDWKDGVYPGGWANKPVTWVSLEDARAYAAWAGKRLPHEWEWQYAAQGADGRLFPWGNLWDPSAAPIPDLGRTMRGPDDVDAHPGGASPFGIMDLVGNVWQWTDEYLDEHTRGGILRGGSYYRPQGSKWYFPQAYRNDQHGKLLLMAPSKDRSGAVGFRCVVDEN
ncbi:MAG: SUMF1/EgtB/PvdO family nonheme iron enzyme [Terracidiphilus sp.]|jgi:formylglycine-generating enzyme required for sulfatase activity